MLVALPRSRRCGIRDLTAAIAWVSIRCDGSTGLAKEAEGCQRCDLYRNATQTVFGDGAPAASLVLVGEQPGDQEDKAGKPFVGPAGRLLDKALDRRRDRSRAGLSDQRGEALQVRAARQAPNSQDAEPDRGGRVSALVARRNQRHTARRRRATWGDSSKVIAGQQFSVDRHRGEVLRLRRATTDLNVDPQLVATAHPSAVLRGPPGIERRRSTRSSPICIRGRPAAPRRLELISSE